MLVLCVALCFVFRILRTIFALLCFVTPIVGPELKNYLNPPYSSYFF